MFFLSAPDHSIFDGELNWWVAVIEIQSLDGLFWLLQTDRNATAQDLKGLRDDFAGFELYVATTYAAMVYLKDVERRLTAHLLETEGKLDRVIEGGTALRSMADPPDTEQAFRMALAGLSFTA